MSQSIREELGITNALLSILQQQEKEAADPSLTGVSGEPIPADMVATGADQMMPPPGAASGMAPPPGDPAAGGDPNAQPPQATDVLMQLGMLIEQLGGQMLQVLTQMQESQQRTERTMLMLAGNAMGPDAADIIESAPEQTAAPAAPKTASGGEFVTAQARDGVASRDNSQQAEDLRTAIRSNNSLAAAVLAIRGHGN